jgi:hypothetical protein
MEIRMEIGFNELYDMSWSGGKDTLDNIYEHDKEEELMNLLEEVFFDEIPSDTEVNDFLWFERSMIYEHCGLDENGEEPTDEDEIEEMKREQETDLIKAETFDDFCGDRCCELCLFGDCAMKCEDVFAEYKNGNMNVDDILE